MQIVSSSVDAVRLFRSGATVTRKATAEASPGAVRVCFTGLPLALDDSSVRLEAAGAATFVDQRVSVELAQPLGAGSSDERELLSLRAEEEEARTDLAVCAKHQETLSKIALMRRVREADQPTPAASASARMSVLTLRDDLLAELHVERARLEREVERLAKRKAALVDAIARASGAAPLDPLALRKTVIATLRAPAAGPLDVSLSYFVAGARWAPSYVLRLDEGLSRARLELRASVCQSSGEDWSGASIALSTAEATRFHELPELKSLRIGRAQQPKRSPRPLERDEKELFADYARAFRPPPRQAPPAPPPPPPPQGAYQVGEVEDSEVTGVGPAAPGFAGMAPPMPGGMPPVPTFAAPASIARRAVAAFSAPAPAMFQPQAAAKARHSAVAPSRGGGGGGMMDDLLSAGPEAPTVAQVIELDARMFDLESLRLPPPEELNGKLRRVSSGELYLDAAPSRGGVTSHAALTRALDAWASQSRRALATDPPDQHVLPAPDSGYFDVFVGEFRVDVPADGAFHSIPIAQGELPVTTRFVTVPREQSDVFRLATLQTPLASPLLRGPCDVYIGREFLLTTTVDGVPPGGTLRVGLGVEQRIKVARNTRFSEATQGLMGGTNALKHQIMIELVSHLSSPIEIEVRERIPSATERDEDIKIEVVAATPAWRPWEAPPGEPPVRGAFAWTVRLAPQGRTDLAAEYVVRIPSKLELVGGNRRD